MSIENTKVIDGLAYDDENKRICLLLADHLDWKDEYKHLMLLQEKLNIYAAFVQNKQYEQQFQKEEITSILIKIIFKYDISEKVEQFLQVAKNTFCELGIIIECHIDN